MSKLAVIRQYSYSPAAGGIFGTILGGIGKFIGKGLGIIKPAAAKVAASPAAQAVISGAAVGAGTALLARGGTAAQRLVAAPGGATGQWAPRRRGRGITARELRGYRKVARLLHKEGMVSKRARGRH